MKLEVKVFLKYFLEWGFVYVFRFVECVFCGCRTHDCCVRDVTEGCGMDRNIGDPLNKAYEAYRNISIENENAKKLLQEKVKAIVTFLSVFLSVIYIKMLIGIMSYLSVCLSVCLLVCVFRQSNFNGIHSSWRKR